MADVRVVRVPSHGGRERVAVVCRVLESGRGASPGIVVGQHVTLAGCGMDTSLLTLRVTRFDPRDSTYLVESDERGGYVGWHAKDELDVVADG